MLDMALFYFFALLTLGGAISTVVRRNAVLSAASLVVSLLGVAGLFLLSGAEFLFAAQIILYIGGITLLFLFVIMLVNIDLASQVRRFRNGWPLILLATAGLAGELIYLLQRSALPKQTVILASKITSTDALAELLLSRYLVAFELASVLLLVAIVGSIWMGQHRDAGDDDLATRGAQ